MDANLGSGNAGITGLFEQHKTRCFHFALHMVGNYDDAMDITQDAFLKLHRDWRRRDPARSPLAWLYAVVRNLAIDHLRRRARHGECAIEEAPGISPEPGPEASASGGELAARVWEAVNSLPPEQREILLLRDWHELNYAEISQALGISMGTVSSRLHHARERLRPRLRRYL
jgi:RNA polymerase sigma-70 factor (ECF subfamily)